MVTSGGQGEHACRSSQSAHGFQDDAQPSIERTPTAGHTLARYVEDGNAVGHRSCQAFDCAALLGINIEKIAN